MLASKKSYITSSYKVHVVIVCKKIQFQISLKHAAKNLISMSLNENIQDMSKTVSNYLQGISYLYYCIEKILFSNHWLKILTVLSFLQSRSYSYSNYIGLNLRLFLNSLLKVRPMTIGIGIIWTFASNIKSQDLSQTYWIKTCIFNKIPTWSMCTLKFE